MNADDGEVTGVEVPWARLDAATLTRLLEDFVTRQQNEDLDDLPLSERVALVRGLLKKRRAAVLYDVLSDSFTLVPRD